jgi:oligopeptide transport system ATP-binding protein
MPNLLEINNLKTSFLTGGGEVQAVRGVSFGIGRGESVGIVGESGSGKSVTFLSVLRLLASTGRIQGGEILFEGRDLVKFSRREMRDIRGKQISMIFQDPMSSLNPLIPVGKQVSEMLWSHNRAMSKSEQEKRTLELLRMVKIPEPEKRMKSFPHEFSGGMRQRVMIAMALACRPSLLIADEPTTALDVSIQDQILKLMRKLQAEVGMSILFITHDLGVVAELCSRVIVMYGGLVMEESPIDDLFASPQHPYTKGLLNSIPSITQDKAKRLTPIAGSPPDMIHPPAGCPFAPRCPYAREICIAQLPPYTVISEGRRSMCWLHTPDAPLTDNPFKRAGEVPA